MPPWRLVRRVRTTRYITGHAVSARFGLIRAGGGVRQPLPSSRERGKIPPTLNNQSDGHPAGHAPPPPGPSRQNSAPHHGKRGVRSIWFCSSRGGRALAASTLARDKAKKIPPTHNNQSEGRPAGHAPPPLGLSRQNAVSARFGLVRAGGAVRQPLPPSREIRQKKYPPHSTINRRVVDRPRPSSARSVASEPRATSRATRCPLDLVWFEQGGLCGSRFHPLAK